MVWVFTQIKKAQELYKHIQELFNTLAQKYHNTQIVEYGQYIKFLFLHIDNHIQRVVLESHKELTPVSFDVQLLFKDVQQKLSAIIPLKNLTIAFNTMNHTVLSYKSVVQTYLEYFFIVAFEYSLRVVSFEIYKENDRLFIMLANIPESNIDTIKSINREHFMLHYTYTKDAMNISMSMPIYNQ